MQTMSLCPLSIFSSKYPIHCRCTWRPFFRLAQHGLWAPFCRCVAPLCDYCCNFTVCFLAYMWFAFWLSLGFPLRPSNSWRSVARTSKATLETFQQTSFLKKYFLAMQNLWLRRNGYFQQGGSFDYLSVFYSGTTNSGSVRQFEEVLQHPDCRCWWTWSLVAQTGEILPCCS